MYTYMYIYIDTYITIRMYVLRYIHLYTWQYWMIYRASVTGAVPFHGYDFQTGTHPRHRPSIRAIGTRNFKRVILIWTVVAHC